MTQKPTVGIIGIGTMGSNLALNIAESGYNIAVYDRDPDRAKDLIKSAGPLAEKITTADSQEAFVKAMAAPRNIIVLVPSGPIVDTVIESLRPLLDKDDLIIDLGNSNFTDTNRRAEAAQTSVEMFLGVGISGGEVGARFGPSLMAGGDKAAWDRIAGMMTMIAAKYDDQPCATYMGGGGAGHFVKMVHNGIEYADMQMIAEAYGIMRDGFGMKADAIGDIFSKWNEGPLQSYLIEISAEALKAKDPDSGNFMLDVIFDKAGQKGTGRWTAVQSLHLGSPVTTIDAAVAARNLSSRVEERQAGENIFGAAPQQMDQSALGEDVLEQALLAGKIACYAQGFSMLSAASAEFEWDLPLSEIAKVWRAGCIIRSAMLDDMADVLSKNAEANLMYAPAFAEKLKQSHSGLRKVVAASALAGNPTPALSAALSYFDTMRTARGTANMIQAQRDFFGAHGFLRTDKEGKGFHGPWALGL